MISFIFLLFLLVSQVVLSAYSYSKINVSNEYAGNDKANVSKDLSLGALVLSLVFLIFIIVLYFFKFIDYSRSEFLLIISIIMVSAILLVVYHYLNLQYKSGTNYKSIEENLKNASVLVNEDELYIALSTGIITMATAVLIAGLLVGKYLISEHKIIKIKEPVYVNMQSSTMKEDYKEPDYMSDVSKNFIV